MLVSTQKSVDLSAYLGVLNYSKVNQRAWVFLLVACVVVLEMYLCTRYLFEKLSYLLDIFGVFPLSFFVWRSF